MIFSRLVNLCCLSLVLATPVRKWYSESLGANYFQTNGFEGNQLVSSYILPDGTLAAGTATWTNGNGSAAINDPDPYENHPDPFLGDGSVIVSGCQVFAVNAGSDSFSVFDIDPTDPARPVFRSTYPSGGEFPVSIAASPAGDVVCVLNGGAVNGFRCYQADDGGWWKHLSGWDRTFGLNLTTPPHGPVGNTPSQMAFSSDMSYLYVAVKGRIPNDLNNPTGKLQPGYIAAYRIDKTWTLASQPTITTTPIPFSIAEDLNAKGLYFATDVSTGYTAFRFGSDATSVAGTIPNQGATCWVAQSPLTGSFYTVDIAGRSNITEISIDPGTLQGTILASHPLGTNSSGTDNAIFSDSNRGVDWMYVNAPAYQSVHTFKISAPGKFELIQRFGVGDMPQSLVPTMGFAGQAVYYK